MNMPWAIFLGFLAIAVALLIANQQRTISAARSQPDFAIAKTEAGNVWRIKLDTGQVSLCVPATVDGAPPLCGKWSGEDRPPDQRKNRKDFQLYRP